MQPPEVTAYAYSPTFDVAFSAAFHSASVDQPHGHGPRSLIHRALPAMGHVVVVISIGSASAMMIHGMGVDSAPHVTASTPATPGPGGGTRSDSSGRQLQWVRRSDDLLRESKSSCPPSPEAA